MFGGIFKPKSKNYRKYCELFGKGSVKEREAAGEFVDNLPLVDQIKLLKEVSDITFDELLQCDMREYRKHIEEILPAIGFSEN